MEEEQKGDSQTQAAADLKPISTEHWPSLEINDGIIKRGGWKGKNPAEVNEGLEVKAWD